MFKPESDFVNLRNERLAKEAAKTKAEAPVVIRRKRVIETVGDGIVQDKEGLVNKTADDGLM